MRHTINAVMFFLLTAAAFGQTCTPFKYDDHRIIVQVKVNGQAFNFLLDTGTQGVLLDTATANVLHLKATGKANIIGFGGQDESHVGYTQANIEFGAFEVHDMDSVIFDLSKAQDPKGMHISGVLGQSFLELHTVTISHTAHCVMLQ